MLTLKKVNVLTMRQYSDIEIFKLIKEGDSDILRFLYKELRPLVRSFILKNSGTPEDVEDVLQDGIIAFYNNVNLGKFQLQKTKITTYIIQICKFIWSNQLRSSRSKTSVKLIEEHAHLHYQEPEYYETINALEKSKEVEKIFKSLGEHCQKILMLFYFENKDLKTINKIMGMTGNTSKNQKYRCMKKLRTLYGNLNLGNG